MWFWFALSAAIISGVSVTFNKRVLNRGVHSSVVSFFLFLILTLGSLVFLIRDHSGSIDNIFFIACGVSSIVFAVAKTMQLNIFSKNNLSEIYPLASLSPLILYIIGLVTLNESIKLTALIGLFIMISGVYLINYKSENKDLLHPLKHLFQHKSSILYIMAIILSSISAIAEKVAINHTVGSNIFYLAFYENLFLMIITGAYVIKTNKLWANEIKVNFGKLLIAGLIYGLLYFLVISGFKDGPVALVSAIKKMEVLFVLGISYFVFKERPSKYVYIGVILMLIAVLLIKL
jgi:drug/metabolite transporter (DMT)-like permease